MTQDLSECPKYEDNNEQKGTVKAAKVEVESYDRPIELQNYNKKHRKSKKNIGLYESTVNNTNINLVQDCIKEIQIK